MDSLSHAAERGGTTAASSSGRPASAEDAGEAALGQQLLRRHLISVTGTGAGAPGCSLDGTSQAGVGQAHLCSCAFVSPPGPGPLGQTCLQQKYLQEGASTPMLPGKPAAGSPASGATWADSPMSAVHGDSSSCRAARKVPGTGRCPGRPGGRVGSLPLREAPLHPCSGGRRPRRGLESFDYLIAADTKPIFPPLAILSIVTTFLFGPQSQERRCRFACLLKVSQEEKGAPPAGCADKPPLSLPLSPLPLLSLPHPKHSAFQH